jgi:hypothetical protein
LTASEVRQQLFLNNTNNYTLYRSCCKVEFLGKGLRSQGLFRTFEDFEFRARFTDRKNTPTFAAVMVKKLKLPFSYLKLGRKFVVILAGYESGRYSGQSLCLLYRPANLYLLLRLYYAADIGRSKIIDLRSLI